jgi:uncharacterized protein YecE (DUF72 family)
VFEQWAQRAPEDFIFALKMSRFLTHLKRLHEPKEPVHRFLERARKLGGKRGPTLVQLPPTMKLDAGLLDAALAQFGPGERLAFEPRHESWFVPEVRAVLERRGAALCLADSRGRRSPQWRTADWGYVRFHHGLASPVSCYGRAAMETWARRLAEMWPTAADVFVYFNNDAHGCALRDAIVLARISERLGMHPTRLPPLSEVTVSRT